MSERGTAGEQLERILYLLPLASREGWRSPKRRSVSASV